ncbi:uncharacterized protein LOC142590212 [Dermacentor variabilis]|uniref:uncharacterized protein LOC142590212 n=1 Tax=Dermacentor variabilis TaxID=34621 RepID=UPI003F5B685D
MASADLHSRRRSCVASLTDKPGESSTTGSASAPAGIVPEVRTTGVLFHDSRRSSLSRPKNESHARSDGSPAKAPSWRLHLQPSNSGSPSHTSSSAGATPCKVAEPTTSTAGSGGESKTTTSSWMTNRGHATASAATAALNLVTCPVTPVQNGKAETVRNSPKVRPRFSPNRSSTPSRSSRHSFSVDCGDVMPGMSPHGSLRGRGGGTGSGSFLSVTGSHGHTSSSATVSPDASATNKYRLVVLGGPRVGKSAIVHRFLHDRFLHDYSATVEEFHRGEYDVGGGATVALDILDTGGSFEFPAMRRLAIDSGDAFLLVYAIDERDSFELVRKLRDDVLAARKAPPIVVVGNKTDLESHRQVQSQMVEPIVCIDWEHGWVECSAKDNTNIARVFQELLAQAHFKSKVAKATQSRRMSLPVNSFSRDQLSPVFRPKGSRKRTSCAVS